MPKYRVISVDGGASYFSAGMFMEIHELLMRQGKQRNFLGQADMFAGTSAGAWLMLFLAQYEDPDAAVEFSLDFWAGILDAMYQTPPLEQFVRGVGVLTGQSAMHSTQQVRDYFIEVFGADKTLGDLKKKVLVPAFQLDNEDLEIPRWKSKIFHNFDRRDPDWNELVVDVCMRTASPPVVMPIAQSITGEGPGYVDGGFFAPSPSLVAIAQIMGSLDSAQHNGALAHMEDDISVLSVGLEQVRKISPFYFNGVANWGYAPWLLDPQWPLRLVDLSVASGTDAIDYMTRQIVGDNHYCRLAPLLNQNFLADPPSGATVKEAVAEMMENPSIRAGNRRAAEWLASPLSNWFNDGPSKHATTAAKGRRTASTKRRRPATKKSAAKTASTK